MMGTAVPPVVRVRDVRLSNAYCPIVDTVRKVYATVHKGCFQNFTGERVIDLRDSVAQSTVLANVLFHVKRDSRV